MGMLDTGPKLNWTSDNRICDRYQVWKTKVELIFSSVLSKATPEEKVSYLRYWMGNEGIPLVKKWTATGKLDFSNKKEISTAEGIRKHSHFEWIHSTSILGSRRCRIQT